MKYYSPTSYSRPEYWDLYNHQMKKVGKIKKGDPIPPGLFHLCVEAIPTDMQGHILITQRAYCKEIGSGKFEFPAGSVMHGENPGAAALRELREETGLNGCKIIELQTNKTKYDPNYSGIIRKTYLVQVLDLLNQPVTLQPGETMDYKIVTVNELINQFFTDGSFERSRLDMYTDGFIEKLREYVGKPLEGEKPVPEKPKLRLVKVDPQKAFRQNMENDEPLPDAELEEPKDLESLF